MGFSVGSFSFVALGTLNTPVSFFVVTVSSVGSSKKPDINLIRFPLRVARHFFHSAFMIVSFSYFSCGIMHL